MRKKGMTMEDFVSLNEGTQGGLRSSKVPHCCSRTLDNPTVTLGLLWMAQKSDCWLTK